MELAGGGVVALPVSLEVIGESAAVVVVGIQHMAQSFEDFERNYNNYMQSKASESSSGNGGGTSSLYDDNGNYTGGEVRQN